MFRGILLLLVSMLVATSVSTAQDGEKAFTEVCVACHTIGSGNLVGPDLAGVTDRRPMDWLVKFIKSPQAMIESGDKTADSLFQAFNQVMMPDQVSYDEAQIKEILAYISAQSKNASGATAQGSGPELKGDWQRGEQLFIGTTRFASGGPACNSCHNVNIQGTMTGGALAKDLTQAVSRLTANGTKAFFGSAKMPMPQMQQSYEGRALSAQEIADVLAFLTHADELAKTQPLTSSVASNMLTGGIVGGAVLIILFSLFWIKRKQKAVNQSIFERQIRSS